jgi:DeoR/GlpR family transcriptional regulator of sugar metabolism
MISYEHNQVDIDLFVLISRLLPPLYFTIDRLRANKCYNMIIVVHVFGSHKIMPAETRQHHILALLEEHGFLPVKELSQLCQVAEITIRRDLEVLAAQQQVQRTYGGAVRLRTPSNLADVENLTPTSPELPFLERIDVLIAASVDPVSDELILTHAAKRSLPVIAESTAFQEGQPLVALDNYQAGKDLGMWAGDYAARYWQGTAYALDLSYHLPNTQACSRGFRDGLKEALPSAELVLSLNTQADSRSAYQLTRPESGGLTRDALSVHKQINIIFAVNDSLAWGAIQACQELGIDPQRMLVLPVGLEGNTLKDALAANQYCKAGAAAFPEIAGPVCIQAARSVFRGEPLPSELKTPYAILTPVTLAEYYVHSDSGWTLRPEAVQRLPLPINITPTPANPPGRSDPCIGFIVPFAEHEWYKNLVTSMAQHAQQAGVKLEIIDIQQVISEELELRRRAIAHLAAGQVRSGEVICIDGGPITIYLAEYLAKRQDEFTVITNSTAIFNILSANAGITLLSTGGALRRSSQALVGPSAEAALNRLHADKLFLSVASITLDFGLSHTNISEVTIKQAMIRSAGQVILLADHTNFQQGSLVQVAPLSAVHRLISDGAFPASIRLALAQMGIHLVLAAI